MNAFRKYNQTYMHHDLRRPWYELVSYNLEFLNIRRHHVGETGGFLPSKPEEAHFAIELSRNGKVFFTKSTVSSGFMQN